MLDSSEPWEPVPADEPKVSMPKTSTVPERPSGPEVAVGDCMTTRVEPRLMTVPPV